MPVVCNCHREKTGEGRDNSLSKGAKPPDPRMSFEGAISGMP